MITGHWISSFLNTWVQTAWSLSFLLSFCPEVEAEQTNVCWCWWTIVPAKSGVLRLTWLLDPFRLSALTILNKYWPYSRTFVCLPVFDRMNLYSSQPSLQFISQTWQLQSSRGWWIHRDNKLISTTACLCYWFRDSYQFAGSLTDT